LRSSFIIVIGLGGVGSHATSALARSGVSKIRLVDFDQVTLSSLNRHAVATLADVGTPKVRCIQKRLEQITPWVHFDARNVLFSDGVAETLLSPWSQGAEKGQTPDFVIDAIDNIDSKVQLLTYCHKNSIPVISSMGAGCKSDPSRIFIGDISNSTEDPLSRATRRRLRQAGIDSGIPVVYSTEKPGPGKASLLPLPEDEYKKGTVGDLGVLPDFRVRILPVLGTMPAMFGYAVANHAILEISGYPHDYIPLKGRDKMYESILGNLQGLEERLAGGGAVGLRIPVNKEDVGYIVEEVYRGRSVVSGLTTRLVLVRWRKPSQTPEGKFDTVDTRVDGQKVAKIRLNNLVCMTKDEAVRHEREILRGNLKVEELYDGDVLSRVATSLKEEEGFEKYR
jgi:tRNA threonylcarbamoyladenosine dehydratase